MRPLALELGQVVAKRGKGIAFWGTSERLDDMRMEFCGGEAVAGGDVRKAHEGVHQGKLAGMIEARPNGSSMDIGYVLRRNLWRRGLMTEAVKFVVEWAFSRPDVSTRCALLRGCEDARPPNLDPRTMN